jgi:WD40 repeat protein
VIVNLDDESTLRLYDAETGALRFVLENVTALPSFSPDETRFTVTIQDSGLRIYDARSFTVQDHLTGYTTPPNADPWSPDSGQLLVIPQTGFRRMLGPFHIWTLGRQLSEPLYNVTGQIVWSPDGKHIAAPSDLAKVRIYDATSGELLDTIRYPDVPTLVLQWDRHFLSAISGSYVYGSGLTISVWDFDREAFIIMSPVDIWYNFWLEEDEAVLVDGYSGIQRFSLETGELTAQIELEGQVFFVSPDRRWTAGGRPPSRTPTLFYRLDPFQQVTMLPQYLYRFGYVVWSPDSRYLAGVSDSLVGLVVWEIQTQSTD